MERQLSQAFPRLSESLFCWLGLKAKRQLSQTFLIPSVSESTPAESSSRRPLQSSSSALQISAAPGWIAGLDSLQSPVHGVYPSESASVSWGGNEGQEGSE